MQLWGWAYLVGQNPVSLRLLSWLAYSVGGVVMVGPVPGAGERGASDCSYRVAADVLQSLPGALCDRGQELCRVGSAGVGDGRPARFCLDWFRLRLSLQLPIVQLRRVTGFRPAREDAGAGSWTLALASSCSFHSVDLVAASLGWDGIYS